MTSRKFAFEPALNILGILTRGPQLWIESPRSLPILMSIKNNGQTLKHPIMFYECQQDVVHHTFLSQTNTSSIRQRSSLPKLHYERMSNEIVMEYKYNLFVYVTIITYTIPWRNLRKSKIGS